MHRPGTLVGRRYVSLPELPPGGFSRPIIAHTDETLHVP